MDGAVAKLADALDLGSSSFGSAGSTPVSPTCEFIDGRFRLDDVGVVSRLIVEIGLRGAAKF